MGTDQNEGGVRDVSVGGKSRKALQGCMGAQNVQQNGNAMEESDSDDDFQVPPPRKRKPQTSVSPLKDAPNCAKDAHNCAGKPRKEQKKVKSVFFQPKATPPTAIQRVQRPGLNVEKRSDNAEREQKRVQSVQHAKKPPIAKPIIQRSHDDGTGDEKKQKRAVGVKSAPIVKKPSSVKKTVQRAHRDDDASNDDDEFQESKVKQATPAFVVRSLRCGNETIQLKEVTSKHGEKKLLEALEKSKAFSWSLSVDRASRKKDALSLDDSISSDSETEQANPNPDRTKVRGIAIACKDDTVWYLPLSRPVPAACQQIFDPSSKRVHTVFGGSDQLPLLHQLGISVPESFWDASVGHWAAESALDAQEPSSQQTSQKKPAKLSRDRKSVV